MSGSAGEKALTSLVHINSALRVAAATRNMRGVATALARLIAMVNPGKPSRRASLH